MKIDLRTQEHELPDSIRQSDAKKTYITTLRKLAEEWRAGRIDNAVFETRAHRLTELLGRSHTQFGYREFIFYATCIAPQTNHEKR